MQDNVVHYFFVVKTAAYALLEQPQPQHLFLLFQLCCWQASSLLDLDMLDLAPKYLKRLLWHETLTFFICPFSLDPGHGYDWWLNVPVSTWTKCLCDKRCLWQLSYFEFSNYNGLYSFSGCHKHSLTQVVFNILLLYIKARQDTLEFWKAKHG